MGLAIRHRPLLDRAHVHPSQSSPCSPSESFPSWVHILHAKCACPRQAMRSTTRHGRATQPQHTRSQGSGHEEQLVLWQWLLPWQRRSSTLAGTASKSQSITKISSSNRRSVYLSPLFTRSDLSLVVWMDIPAERTLDRAHNRFKSLQHRCATVLRGLPFSPTLLSETDYHCHYYYRTPS